ncbi:P-loop containing nucleoside triphosphate hydrolase protein [Mycena olivaceomarginata]|nr:P-loop containing nucleoside triphosphate hydrolase protein [Mycena olivaceomarginata]
MLPSKPRIFHGRESELSDILELFRAGTPRVAILGSGGMGKTSLARAVLHHTDIASRYANHRFFVACDSAINKIELAALIGAHLGLKAGMDLTQQVLGQFSSFPPSLLVLDNFEHLWEPTECRSDVEEFLSLLTDIKQLALIITMRGVERPAKVRWTRPLLRPLEPLQQSAALEFFYDIAEDFHDPEQVDKVLALTDNMPLAINLIAHLVDVEGCSSVLARWEVDKTALISEGYDKRSNLDLSNLLSLSSPRLKSVPHAQDLLSLLALLPDGISDEELLQSSLPMDNILGCKTALIKTALAYIDKNKRLRAWVPIRESMLGNRPPTEDIIRPLLTHYQGLLELQVQYRGTQLSSATVVLISSNIANIHNLLRNGLIRSEGHPDLISCTLHLLELCDRVAHPAGPPCVEL